MIYLLEKSFNGCRFYDDEKIDSMTKWISVDKESMTLNVIPNDPRERTKIKILRMADSILDFVDAGWCVQLRCAKSPEYIFSKIIRSSSETEETIKELNNAIKLLGEDQNLVLEVGVFDVLERKWNIVYKKPYKSISQSIYEFVNSGKIPTDLFGVLKLFVPILKLDYPLSFICVNEDKTQYYALLENPTGWNLTEVELEDIRAVDESNEPLQYLFRGNRNKFLLSVNGNKVEVKPVKEFTGENEIKGNMYVRNFFKI